MLARNAPIRSLEPYASQPSQEEDHIIILKLLCTIGVVGLINATWDPILGKNWAMSFADAALVCSIWAPNMLRHQSTLQCCAAVVAMTCWAGAFACCTGVPFSGSLPTCFSNHSPACNGIRQVFLGAMVQSSSCVAVLVAVLPPLAKVPLYA